MYRVILVDDEVLTREAVRENMDWSGLGCELAGCFQHGREAADYLREHPVDIVMTDICMPYMDGLELSKMISEVYPDSKVLILSGYDNFEYAKQAMKYKVSDYLLKPFSAEELSEALTSLTKKLDEEREASRNLVEIRQLNRRNQQLIKSQLLMNLICGSRTLEELRPELDRYGVRLDDSWYSVALLDVAIGGQDKHQTELLSFSVCNIAEEIIVRERMGQVFQRMDYKVVVLLAAENRQICEQRLKRVFREIIDASRRCMGLEVTAGIGSFVEKTTDLHLSYEGAEEMLDFEYTWGRGNLFFKGQVDMAGQWQSWDDVREALNDSLKAGRRKRAQLILKDLFSKIRTSYLKKEGACAVVQDTLRSTRLLLEELGLEDFELCETLADTSGQVEAQKDLDSVRLLLENFYGRAQTAIQELKDRKGDKRAVLAENYIKSHYMESSLNLQAVCDYMAMSPSRFSAMFKQCTGNSFIDALTRVRMDKAKELLERTSLKNYQIAERVGYSDPHYFSLSFKKVTGKTPTEYAKEKRG